MQPNSPSTSALLLEIAESLREAKRVVPPFDLEQLLQLMQENDGSHLHINSDSVPMLRISGEMVGIGEHRLSGPECTDLVLSLLPLSLRRELYKEGKAQTYHKHNGQVYKLHAFLERGTVGASFHRLRTDIPSLMELGISRHPFDEFIENSQGGLCLILGNALSGKLTTLHSLIQHYNESYRLRILNLESNLHFWHFNEDSVVMQRDLLHECNSLKNGLTSTMLQDIDLLCVAETEEKTAWKSLLQITAGGTNGIQLISNNDLEQGLIELAEEMIQEDPRYFGLFVNNLKLVLFQQLIERKDGKGHIPIFAILKVTPRIKQTLLNRKFKQIYKIMREEKMLTTTAHLARLVEVDVISFEDACKLASPEELKEHIGEDSDHSNPPPTIQEETPLMSWL